MKERVELRDFSPSIEAVSRAQRAFAERFGNLPGDDRIRDFVPKAEDLKDLEPVIYGGEPRPRKIYPATPATVPTAEPDEVVNPLARVYYGFWKVGDGEIRPVFVRHTIGSEINHMVMLD